MAAWLRRRTLGTADEDASDQPGPEDGVAFPDPASALPPEPRPFVGAEQLALVKTLQHVIARPCLAGVLGPAGSGKTALCEKLANTVESRRGFLRDERGEPVHRRFWVDLEGCESGPVLEERVARALGCTSFGAAVSRLSNGLPSLVVLDFADGVWNRAGADDPALSRLIECTRRGARLVVTLRARGGPPFTAELEAPKLDDATAQELSEALGAGPLDVEAVRRCDGSPLAVTLLARASGGDPGDDGRTGVPFALAASVAALDDIDRRAWVALSLFPAGLGRDDVGEVLAPLGRAEHHVARLYQMGLARRVAAGLRVPEPVRAPAPAAGGAAEWWQRYADRGRAVVGAGDGGDWLVLHQANLAALARRRPLPDGALDLACEGLLVGRPASPVDATENALLALAEAAIGEGPVPGRVVEVEAALRDRYRISACRALLALMLEDSRRRADREAEARVLESLATLAHRASEYDQAQALLGQARDITGDSGDASNRADVLFDEGRVAQSRSNLDQAEVLLSQAQEMYDGTGNAVGRANARLYRGQLAGDLGRHDRAEALLLEAQAIYDGIGNQSGGANARLYRGQLAARSGDHDRAEALLLEAQAIYDGIGNHLGRANARLYRGDLASRQGRPGPAEILTAEALQIYEDIAHPLGQANARIYLGELLATRGLVDEAERLFGVAQRIYDQIGDRRGQANARYDLGRIAEIKGQGEQAGALLAEAQRIYDEITPPPPPPQPRPVRPHRAQRARPAYRRARRAQLRVTPVRRRPLRAQRVRPAHRRAGRAKTPPAPDRRRRRSQRARRAHRVQLAAGRRFGSPGA